MSYSLLSILKSPGTLLAFVWELGAMDAFHMILEVFFGGRGKIVTLAAFIFLIIVSL